MATIQTKSTASATTQTGGIVKKPGPPVPPRPQHTTSLIATTAALRTSTMTKSNNNSNNNNNNNNQSTTLTSFATKNNACTMLSSTINTVEQQNNNNHNHSQQQPPIIHKKPIVTRQTSAGRTVIYKSPINNYNNNNPQQQQNPKSAIQAAVRTSIAAKPPLKLRKAPDVPKEQQESAAQEKAANVVILNRHNSMGCAGNAKPVALKETRLSLGRVDTEKFGKIHLDQLQLSSQPLPKPRKIVQMPVATLDMEDNNKISTTHSSMANIFRRSKTTLDNKASRANASTVNNGNNIVSSPNRFLSGRTVEFRNNLKNAAERLFAEIIVSQHKQVTEPPPTIITKHERAIQHSTLTQKPEQSEQTMVTVAVNTTPVKVNVTNNNCTRISINGTTTITPKKQPQFESLVNSPEKKKTFHEILISELAAMRTKSSSMENLQTKEPTLKTSTPKESAASSVSLARMRCNSVEEYDEEQHDNEDVDADNIEDAEGDEEFLRKTLKLGTKNATRNRCPSGCSSDSSPYGTERSARIRTSDWIEVQDNGKEVTLTSCHISLEDSGLEDEERMDDMSTSGVGDSWDSVKETQNEQRCRNIKR